MSSELDPRIQTCHNIICNLKASLDGAVRCLEVAIDLEEDSPGEVGLAALHLGNQTVQGYNAMLQGAAYALLHHLGDPLWKEICEREQNDPKAFEVGAKMIRKQLWA